MKKQRETKDEKQQEREKIDPREWTGADWRQAILAREILEPCKGRRWLLGR